LENWAWLARKFCGAPANYFLFTEKPVLVAGKTGCSWNIFLLRPDVADFQSCFFVPLWGLL